MSDDTGLTAPLQAYGRAVLGLADWVHDSWPASLGLPSVRPACRHSPPLARVASVRVRPGQLAAALGLGVPAAACFALPAHRVCVLEPVFLCRVLRARGLLRRRPAVLHCLDAGLQRSVTDWVHPAVFEAVLRAGDRDLERDVAGLPMATALAPPADLLSWEGFCLFRRDGVWTDPALERLVRLGFPKEMTLPPAWAEQPGAHAGSAWVLERLVKFVPEVPWLCG